MLKASVLLVALCQKWQELGRTSPRTKSTVMQNPFCVHALVGWKGLQVEKGHRICCFLSCSTSLKKNLSRNIHLYPLMTSKEMVGKLRC